MDLPWDIKLTKIGPGLEFATATVIFDIIGDTGFFGPKKAEISVKAEMSSSTAGVAAATYNPLLTAECPLFDSDLRLTFGVGDPGYNIPAIPPPARNVDMGSREFMVGPGPFKSTITIKVSTIINYTAGGAPDTSLSIRLKEITCKEKF